VSGYRNHYMKLEIPLTWRNLASAGFEYDSTLGYADTIGFRNGMCHPFKPYDLETDSSIDLVEIPLALMDTTLYSYLGLDSEAAWKLSEGLVDRVEQLGGVLTVLWHNNYMVGERLDLYRRILAYCQGKGAWMASASEVAGWWRENGLFGLG